MILLHCVISDGRFAVFGLGLLPVLSSEVLFGISCLFSLFLVLIEARVEAAACFTYVGGLTVDARYLMYAVCRMSWVAFVLGVHQQLYLRFHGSPFDSFR